MNTGGERNRDRLAKLWQAVFQPELHVPALELPPIETEGPHFQHATALNSAWLCHAMYVVDRDERVALLDQAGFDEVAQDEGERFHWSLVRSQKSPQVHLAAFRGTSDLRHWLFNVNTILTRWPQGGRVHNGFARAYARIQEPLANALASLPEEATIYFTGHSLGGALALLAASEHCGAAAYTYGCPLLGNPTFAETLEAHLPVHRVVCDQDVVTTIPFELSVFGDLAYKHTGQPVHLRPDKPLTINERDHLPKPSKSWRQALHAMVEGDHLGEPLPDLLDHAPIRYLTRLQEALPSSPFAS